MMCAFCSLCISISIGFIVSFAPSCARSDRSMDVDNNVVNGDHRRCCSWNYFSICILGSCPQRAVLGMLASDFMAKLRNIESGQISTNSSFLNPFSKTGDSVSVPKKIIQNIIFAYPRGPSPLQNMHSLQAFSLQEAQHLNRPHKTALGLRATWVEEWNPSSHWG